MHSLEPPPSPRAHRRRRSYRRLHRHPSSRLDPESDKKPAPDVSTEVLGPLNKPQRTVSTRLLENDFKSDDIRAHSGKTAVRYGHKREERSHESSETAESDQITVKVRPITGATWREDRPDVRSSEDGIGRSPRSCIEKFDNQERCKQTPFSGTRSH